MDSAHTARAQSERLNQAARRLDQAATVQEWAAALLDGVHHFAPRVVLFQVTSAQVLKYQGHRAADFDSAALAAIELPLRQAPAFAGAAETLDTIITLASPNELSAPLAEALILAPDSRVFLFPILTGRATGQRRAAAILYAESTGTSFDVNALELLAAFAGAALECRFAQGHAGVTAHSGALLGIAPAPSPDPMTLTRRP